MSGKKKGEKKPTAKETAETARLDAVMGEIADEWDALARAPDSCPQARLRARAPLTSRRAHGRRASRRDDE